MKYDVFRQIYSVLTDEQKADTLELKKKFQELHDLIEKKADDTPTINRRMINLGLTNLEQSALWVIKGITAS